MINTDISSITIISDDDDDDDADGDDDNDDDDHDDDDDVDDNDGDATQGPPRNLPGGKTYIQIISGVVKPPIARTWRPVC